MSLTAPSTKAPASLLTAVIVGLFLGGAPAFATKDSVVTAVFSSLSNGYAREKLPNGSFKREYYAIARGNYLPGRYKNPSIDSVTFPTIAGLVARHLAEQNYFLAQDSKSANILLLITWGTTVPFADGNYRNGLGNLGDAMNKLQTVSGGINPGSRGMGRSAPPGSSAPGRSADGTQSAGAADTQAAMDELEQQLVVMQSLDNDRIKADDENARRLGYAKEMNSLASPARFSGSGSYYDDLTSDIEEERYYVIISAYDFPTATHEGKRKLLWATRVSITARGNKFDEQLADMLAMAGHQFGRDSGRLIRQYREGRVDFGDLKILGAVPDQPPQEKPPGK